MENNIDEELNVNEATSEALCGIIICFRYTGLFEAKSLECMKELIQRRENGNDFPFEETIEEELKKLPKFKFDLKKIFTNSFDINQILNNLK